MDCLDRNWITSKRSFHFFVFHNEFSENFAMLLKHCFLEQHHPCSTKKLPFYVYRKKYNEQAKTITHHITLNSHENTKLQ